MRLPSTAGRAAIPRAERAARAARLGELRAALGVSQERLAAASGGLLHRVYISRMERGANALTGARALRGLAKAAGVDLDAIVGYLDGTIDLATLLERRSAIPMKLLRDPFVIGAGVALLEGEADDEDVLAARDSPDFGRRARTWTGARELVREHHERRMGVKPPKTPRRR